MKRVGSIKQALKPSLKSNSSNNHSTAPSDVANNNESKMSILGNSGPTQINGPKPAFHKSISSFLKKGTLTRKKDKNVSNNQVRRKRVLIYSEVQFNNFFHAYQKLRKPDFLNAQGLKTRFSFCRIEMLLRTVLPTNHA